MHTTSEARLSTNTAYRCVFAPAHAGPDRTALVVLGLDGARQTITFGALDQRVRAVAAGLIAQGARPGDRVVVGVADVLDHLTGVFAAMAAGLVAVPLPAALSDEERAFRTADADPAVVLVEPTALRALLSQAPIDAPVAVRAGDPALIVHTSGTSATPKGVLHAHRALAARELMRDAWTDIRRDDVVLHAGRLGWTYTLGVGAIDPWSVGGCAVHVAERPVASAWPELIARSGATVFAAVPSIYRQILKHARVAPGALGRVRHVLSAGETLRSELHQAWRRASGLPIYEALGMTEVSTYVSTGPGIPARPGSAGKPQPGRIVAVLPRETVGLALEAGDTLGAEWDTTPLGADQLGLLAVHRTDPGLMIGYWRRPDEDQKVYRGPWFVGGDLAAMDADGYVWFHGRDDEVMNAFGHRVSPAEVEAVLARHPTVGEVAVTELDVREDLSVIAAFVVPAHGAAVRAEELLAFAAEHLSPFKRPKELRVLDALPRGPNGKLLRRMLGRG
ncbi:MAG: acyl-CoA synthetase [Deltaproteobacteria bacterium]|nr:acyl-CoA synthetase [Deltaproteobacteria bacterium]